MPDQGNNFNQSIISEETNDFNSIQPRAVIVIIEDPQGVNFTRHGLEIRDELERMGCYFVPEIEYDNLPMSFVDKIREWTTIRRNYYSLTVSHETHLDNFKNLIKIDIRFVNICIRVLYHGRAPDPEVAGGDDDDFYGWLYDYMEETCLNIVKNTITFRTEHNGEIIPLPEYIKKARRETEENLRDVPEDETFNYPICPSDAHHIIWKEIDTLMECIEKNLERIRNRN